MQIFENRPKKDTKREITEQQEEKEKKKKSKKR